MNSVTFNPHISSILVETSVDLKCPYQAINRFCQLSYAQYEHAWSYIGKIAILSRHLMNAAANHRDIVSWACDDFPLRIKHITTQLKLLSVLSVIFSLYEIKQTAERVFKSFLQNDKEGVALGALSLAIVSADTFDSITTFVNSALAIASLPPVESFSAIGLPLAFAIAGMGTLSRAIKIAKAFNLYRNLKPSHERSAQEMKMKMEGLGILANAIILSGLVLFSIGAISSIPFLLLALGFMIRISSLVYQDCVNN